jgi:hypothetical protein
MRVLPKIAPGLAMLVMGVAFMRSGMAQDVKSAGLGRKLIIAGERGR